jgi:hypothetical protein
MYNASVPGLPVAVRVTRLGLVLMLSGIASGCDVEWGGASFHLENPAPQPVESEATAAVEEVVPLPAGPLLWVVRSTGQGGEALALPVARLEGGLPAPLDFPAPVPEGYRERFDQAFAAAGTELALGAGGSRAGSLVLAGPPRTLDSGCPSVVSGSMLLSPGANPPLVAFAAPEGFGTSEIRVSPQPQPDNRMRSFGPILAERLLRQGGEDQPFLAQRADLVAVRWPGDERPAMAATYLINDALDRAPPDAGGVSLFFLARFDPAVGYVTEWSEMRTYGGGSREAFTWLQATPGISGRIDFAILHDGQARRIVASAARGEEVRRIDWIEEARCPSLELLEGAGG